MKKIKKILIANRGEIACRVMKTCGILGISTVAVYSEADKNALHVEMADETVCIGAAPARESYLVIDKIIAAAKQTGADAIHPGYGFLSENEEFAEKCAKNNIIFIGPPASAILAMGGKSQAKALMEKAKVPLVPGYHGDNQDEKVLAKEAEKMVYPVLIKASAGGGGKGMRVVEIPDQFAEALQGAKREAKGSFGDDHVLIEKYLINPRHVEIQVFADSFGNTVYLFERDCSVQRRHQKVIEEAPAPHMSEKTRAKMGEAAVAAAKAIGYVGAGTVEFLLDAHENFYFMEMNTRLQVEHPVTECITGLDLVALQIAVAEGQKLPFTQRDLAINGHAIEVRVYAEDPMNNFLPGAGKIKYLRFPESSDVVRIDTGVRECVEGVSGDVISIHYDPMIAKIITWGETRDKAIENMRDALDETIIFGPKTNISFLRDLLVHKSFQAGDVSTSFIKKHEGDLLKVKEVPEIAFYLATLGLIAERSKKIDISFDPWSNTSGWRIGAPEKEIFSFKGATVFVSSLPNGHIEMMLNDKVVTAHLETSGYDQSYHVKIAGRYYSPVVFHEEAMVCVQYHGHSYMVEYHDVLSFNLEDESATGKLTAPMPGKVVAVRVRLGESVKKGEPLIIVEAMKMEHTITAPFDGIIDAVNANVGDQVDEKLELVRFK